MLAPGVEIEIGGRVRTMRPTIRAMMAIEKELGQSSMAIISRIMQFDIGATDTLCILFHGLNGSNDRMERAAIESEMEEKGLSHFSQFIVEFLKGHLEGQPSGKSQADQETTKTPGEPSTVSQSA